MGKGQKLSDKERRFVELFVGECAGNGTQSARGAGYKGNANVLGVTSSQLLRKPKIQKALEKLLKKRESEAVADAEERDRVLSLILRQTTQSARDRIAAIKELNKCSGRHSIKHVMDVTEKLSDLVAGSRASE